MLYQVSEGGSNRVNSTEGLPREKVWKCGNGDRGTQEEDVLAVHELLCVQRSLRELRCTGRICGGSFSRRIYGRCFPAHVADEAEDGALGAPRAVEAAQAAQRSLDIFWGRAIVCVLGVGSLAEGQRMVRKVRGLVLACLAILAPAYGQAQKAASKTIVLKAARMFDGKSNALVKPGAVVVTDGKIVAAGTSLAIPAGAEVIDLGDATLLPGFIDAHTHLTSMYNEDWKQAALDGLRKPIAE